MDHQVVWSEPAQNDLEQIWQYIAADNPRAADKVRNVLDRVDQLKTLPKLGPRYKSQAQGEIRQLVVGKYRIFYQIEQNQPVITVLTVRHGARREPKFD